MYEHIYLVSPKLKLVSHEEVDNAEKELGFKFPKGYREFMTQFGIGEYCTFIEVYSPLQVIRESQYWKSVYSNDWHKTTPTNTINKETIVKCLWIAQDNSDSLLYYPGQERFFVLDRDDENIPDVGSTLSDGLKALNANRYGRPLSIQYFTSQVERFSGRFELNDVEPEFFDEFTEAIKSLGFHDEIEELDWEKTFFSKETSAYFHISYNSLTDGRISWSELEATIDCDQDFQNHPKIEAISLLLAQFQFELTF